MQQRFFALRGAGGVYAAVGDFAFGAMDGAAALGTIFWHAEGLAVGTFLGDFEDVRDHFAGALDEDGVADLQAEAIDFVHVVQGGTTDSDASDLHRLEHGDRSQRAGAAYLHTNVVHYRGFLAGGIFVSDGPPRGFGAEAQLL